MPKAFDKLVAKLKKRSDVKNPHALAAWIVRNKRGESTVDAMIDSVVEGADPQQVLLERQVTPIPQADRQKILQAAKEYSGKKFNPMHAVIMPGHDSSFEDASMYFKFKDASDAEEFATMVVDYIGYKVSQGWDKKEVAVSPEKIR